MNKIKRIKIINLLKSDEYGKVVNVKGWVRTRRGSKNVSFITLNDGSTINNLQVVVDHSIIKEEDIQFAHSGASLSITGEIIKSPGSGQAVEVSAKQIEILGKADPEEYPLQPKKHSLEFLREKAHLRFRTSTFGAITRVRHALIFAIHKFFNDKGFQIADEFILAFAINKFPGDLQQLLCESHIQRFVDRVVDRRIGIDDRKWRFRLFNQGIPDLFQDFFF